MTEGDEETHEIELVKSSLEVLDLSGSEESLGVEGSLLGVGKSSVRNANLGSRNVLQLDVGLVPSSRREEKARRSAFRSARYSRKRRCRLKVTERATHS